MIGKKENRCSGLKEKDGCKHGHDVTQGCFGVGYPDGQIIPVCVNENKTFDESRKVVTVRDYTGT